MEVSSKATHSSIKSSIIVGHSQFKAFGQKGHLNVLGFESPKG